MIIGRQEIYLTKTDSTNQYAKKLVSNTTPFEGTAIFADYQHQGRGQNGNVWQGEPGKNLYASVILYPKFLAIKNHYLLNKAVCLSTWEAIAGYLPNAKIKWPNDIYVNGKKIAGILVENSLQGSVWQSAIVGVGINVNQLEFPAGINAASIANFYEKKINLCDFRKDFYEILDKHYYAVRAGRTESINQIYTKNLLGYHERGDFKTQEEKIFQAIVLGVDNQGNLCLEREGKLHNFRHGKIQQILA